MAVRSATSRTPASISRPFNYAVRLAGSRQQFAEKSHLWVVGMRRHNQDVARLAHFDRGMKIRLSPGWTDTVTAGLPMAPPDRSGAYTGASSPVRPCASCTVAVPNFPSFRTSSASEPFNVAKQFLASVEHNP